MIFWHLNYFHKKESGKQSRFGNIGLQTVYSLDQREDYESRKADVFDIQKYLQYFWQLEISVLGFF